MAEIVQHGLIRAAEVARQTATRQAANGVVYGSFGETEVTEQDLNRMVQAVPSAIAAALGGKAYYFVPLALAEALPEPQRSDETMIASAYTSALGDEAICHRNVKLGDTEGVFISTRVVNDRFALAFEFFINVGHAFVDAAGVPERFSELAWSQVLAEVRGETSQDAFEHRNQAYTAPASRKDGAKAEVKVDEKAKLSFVEAAFSDSLAIYLLSLAVDFDYSELREREYPLLAPAALAARLRLVAELFPPNQGYEFSIRYRRRA
ncbi:hypothetical protein FTO74_19015 [Granulicella sp. WH15]|uniref:hypothetical protein n=1 Tax=Granulicella sp. WH15 TaxID=2602070 RepID=UPI00136695FF|nr:hypothetical protein [Granulicella sp. WH15]QHN05210.1 hypothetical protein FTO74_19015 [Granulicella sp. WH15]